jgi:hypothetical protein
MKIKTKLKNRIAKMKRGTAYPVFLGVFWALAAWELVTYAQAHSAGFLNRVGLIVSVII